MKRPSGACADMPVSSSLGRRMDRKFIAIGLALGAAIGAATNHLAIAIALGLILGIVIGKARSSRGGGA